MISRSLRHRLSKTEKRIATALKEREKNEEKAIKELPIHARHHATAVAAIVLAGQPKIDEPLIWAWQRALQHYGINELARRLGDQVEAARRLHPTIMEGKELSVQSEVVPVV